MPNRLAAEASPYLQQHADNPVDWYPWGREALDRAQREDRPILLSIGYSACHWCHVMEHESFEDETIARLMNDHFVNIKVDREERPDIDQIYQLVVQLLGRSGGWPLTVFLTPEQKPFFAGTYFPPVDRHGLPSFPKILQAVADAYRDKRDELVLQAREITDAISQVARLEGTLEEFSPNAIVAAATRLGARFDDVHGGFGSRPKFPSTISLDVLLRHGIVNDDESACARVLKALDAMRAGGIYDQLGGGFHRYSTDERWLVPHFEKMLYDNALLLRLYIDAYRAFGVPHYADTARQIVGYLVREMLDPGGGFYATQDADSEGHEGRFFVWTSEDVRAACGEDAALACAYFGVDEDGNFEGTNASVLSLARSVADVAIRLSMAPSEVERRLTVAKVAMLTHRDKRPRPSRDEKIMTAWNALLIGALAEGAHALREPTWLRTAERAFDFIWNTNTQDNRALRHCKDGVAKGPGFLDDQAFLGCAALDLYEATGDGRYIQKANALAATIREHFVVDGTLYFTPSDADALIAKTQDVFDHATPSATSVALLLFVRLGALSDRGLAKVAEKQLGKLVNAVKENPFALAQTVIVIDRVARGTVDVVLVGDAGTLVDATYDAYIPNRNVAWASLDGATSAPLLARGKAATAPEAFVCRDHACSPPVTGYRQLTELLAKSLK
jgi:uncharacterized protein